MLSQIKEDYQVYCIAGSQAKYATRELIMKYEMHLARGIKEQPKSFVITSKAIKKLK